MADAAAAAAPTAAAAAAIAVVCAGNFLGATCRGITGFGSAIVNLAVWVIVTLATAASLGGGSAATALPTLQQVVVAEAVASEVVAIPQLLLVRAGATADFRLVGSLALFTAMSAPAGAALLVHLQPRAIEFAMALVLLLIICQRVCAAQCLAALWRRAVGARVSRSGGGGCAALGSETPSIALALVGAPSSMQLSTSVSVDVDAAAAADEECGSCTLPPPPPAATGVLSSPAGPAADGCSASSEALLDSAECVVRVAAHHHHHSEAAKKPCNGRGSGGEEGAEDAPLLDVGAGAHGSTATKLPVPTTSSSSSYCSAGGDTGPCSCSSKACEGCSSSTSAPLPARLRAWWREMRADPAARRAFLRICTAGACAGTASGVIGGLTGMGGPPLMILYHAMRTPKAAVRGTNAVLNLLQFRVLAYALLGAIHLRRDWPLYVAAAGAAVVGLLLGDRLASRMDQAMFARSLVALMVLCCALMFLGSAGLTSG